MTWEKYELFLSNSDVFEELIIGYSAFWMFRNFDYAKKLQLEKVHF